MRFLTHKHLGVHGFRPIELWVRFSYTAQVTASSLV
jgi:hypothetical protein